MPEPSKTGTGDRPMKQAFLGKIITPFIRSSILGKLSGKEWGELMYKHIDHHLQQFGV